MTTPRVEARDSIPTAPGGLPLIGHALPLLRDPVGPLQSIRPLGDIVRIRMGPQSVYVLNSPDLVRQVFAADAESYRKGSFYEKFRPYQGENLFTTDGAGHQRQRRLVLPAFHRERLKRYTDVMRDVAAARCSRWTEERTIDVGAEMYALSSEVVARVLFGGDISGEQIDRIQTWLPVFIRGMGRKVVSPAGWLDRLPTPANRRFDEAQSGLRALVGELVDAHQRDGEDRGDLLSMLVAVRDPDDGRTMSATRVRDEAMTFLTAGIETVSTTLTWLYHEVATHPEAEKRLIDELGTVLGDRPVTFDDLPTLTYTQGVVRETLRLHSPAWMLMRRPAAPVKLGTAQLPAGTELLFSPATLHRDPGIYPGPAEFRPERWLDGNAGETPYLPFSTGPYKCLGDHFALTELATTVATIAVRWRLAPISSRAPREVAGAALTPLQVERIYRAFGVNEKLSAETFARIDRNGDGFVSVDEFVKAARDVWSSNDPEAAGTVMFGPLN